MDFKPKTYRISSVGSILLEISHFSFLCQLKVLGHFAKNWFGKKIPVAVKRNFVPKPHRGHVVVVSRPTIV